MKIKGKTIKEGKKLISGCLYKVRKSRKIVFEEEDTKDIVILNFCLHHEQYGIYGNEYKPPFVEDDGGKKADILALVIDEPMEKFSSWIFDVKKTVGGEDVIEHLVKQLIESVKHKNSIETYLEEYQEEEHIGYIARNLQKERIQETVLKKRKYLEEEKEKIGNLPVLVGTAANLKLLKEEAKLKILEDFLKDSIKIGRKEYKLEYYASIEKDNSFLCELDIMCD